jgi:S1-C subfamily serine protease
MKRTTWFAIAVLVFALVLTGGVVAAASAFQSAAESSSATTAAAVESPVDLAVSQDTVTSLENLLATMYEEVNPSVVNIQVVDKQEMPSTGFPEGFRFQLPEENTPQEFYRRGGGSGFVWDLDGHIVTNNHVVEDADKITVTFADGLSASAELIGADPDSDLAVIKVDVPEEWLHPVEVADSTGVKVGHLAVAIGNPYGLNGTMTVGYVSALDRSLPVENQAVSGGSSYTIPDVIQTDAPINPGNSGGVLLNSRGEVIGVTSAIISAGGSSAGIGFAVPSSIVTKVVPVLIEDGTYAHPWLGISGFSLNPEVAAAMDLDDTQRGALVVDVIPDSPADDAGLQGSDRQIEIEDMELRVGGDVIVAIDGEPIKTFADVAAYLARSTAVDETVTLTVLRDGKEKDVDVTLAARPNSTSEPQTRELEARPARGAWLGILGQALDPELAEAMDLDEEQTGVLVQQVVRGSPADEAGMKGSYKPVTIAGRQELVGGDLIVGIDGEDVPDMETLQTMMQESEPGQEISLTVLRDGDEVELQVTLGERP